MHRSIEILIGRLITDEEFRAAFQRDPRAVLMEASARGTDLTAFEIDALLETDRALWERVAREVDDRLQKASLRQGD